jgi:hypothetical protein
MRESGIWMYEKEDMDGQLCREEMEGEKCRWFFVTLS